MKRKLRDFLDGVLTGLIAHVTAVWLFVFSKGAFEYIGHIAAVFGLEMGS